MYHVFGINSQKCEEDLTSCINTAVQNTNYDQSTDLRIKIAFMNSCLRDCFNQEMRSLAVPVSAGVGQGVTQGQHFTLPGYAWPAQYNSYDLTELCLVDRLGSTAKKVVFPRDFQNGIINLQDFHVSMDQACQDPDYLEVMYKEGTINANVNNVSMIVGTVFSGILLLVYIVQLIILLSKGTVQPVYGGRPEISEPRNIRTYYG